MKGKVLFHNCFQFKDGDIGEKLIIVLNNLKNKNNYLCLKTTSDKNGNYVKLGINNMGCYSDKNVFVYKGDPFKVITYIQFDPNSIFEFTAVDFLSSKFNGNVKIIGDLKEEVINAIINCFKKSEDISDYYLNLLN